MAGEQNQYVCNRCETVTLHTREVVAFNHILHLLVTILCCGWWAPIWLLKWSAHKNHPEPFRCSRCGQAAGDLTAEQHAASAAASAAAKHTAEIYASVRREQKRREQEPIRRLRAEKWRATKAKIRAFVRRAPSRIDAMLRMAAGTENDILFWFFRAVAAAAVTVCFALPVIYGLCWLVGTR